MSSVLTSPPSSSSFISSADQHRLQLGGRLAGLRAMRLVGDHREALALRRGQLAHRFEREGERLDRADDDLLAAGSAVGSSPLLLRALALDRRDHARGALESRRSLPATGVDHVAVGDDETVENSFLCSASCRSARKCAVQAIELVLPEPAECWIRYLPPAPSAQHRGLELPRRVELVIAREDDAS